MLQFYILNLIIYQNKFKLFKSQFVSLKLIIFNLGMFEPILVSKYKHELKFIMIVLSFNVQLTINLLS